MKHQLVNQVAKTNTEHEPIVWLRTPEGTFPLDIDNEVRVKLGDEFLKAFTVGSLRRALEARGELFEQLPDDALLVFTGGDEKLSTSSFYNGGLIINYNAQTVFAGDKQLVLAAREYSLLEFLARHPDNVFSLDQIISACWPPGYSYSGSVESTVRVHVMRLREKLSKAGLPGEKIITNTRGSGYCLNSNLPDDNSANTV